MNDEMLPTGTTALPPPPPPPMPSPGGGWAPTSLPVEPQSAPIDRGVASPSTAHRGRNDDTSPKRGWPRSAKLAALLLAVATVGLGGWALKTRSDVATKDSEIVALTSDLGRAHQESSELTEELLAAQRAASATAADAEQKIGGVQTDLSTVISERDAAKAQADAYAALFPLDVATIAGSDVTGGYSVAASPIPDSCVGYADSAIACGVDSFPSDLTIVGDVTAGFTVSSSWFDAVPLAASGRELQGTGTIKADFANLCDGVEVPTTLTISVGPSVVAPSPTSSGLKAVTLLGTVNLSTAEAGTCLASSRSANIAAQLV
jgi:hypothetical protein